MSKHKGRSRKAYKVNKYYQIGYVIEEGTGDKYPFLQDLIKNKEMSNGKVKFDLVNSVDMTTATTGSRRVAVDLEDDSNTLNP